MAGAQNLGRRGRVCTKVGFLFKNRTNMTMMLVSPILNFLAIYEIYMTTTLKWSVQAGRGGTPSEGCFFLARVAPVVIKNDLSLK